MKILKQISLAAVFIFCVSMSVFAQKDEKKPPLKERPPVIVVGREKGKPKEDKPKEDKPKDDRDGNERRNKPPVFFFKTEY